MLTSGVTLVKALNILYLQMEKRNIKASIKKLYESVQRGDQFSEGLRKQTGVFPEIMVSMVEAGEASGKLDHVITKLAEQFEKDVKLKAKIRSAMTYPIILMVMAICVVLILVTQVLPIFMGMFAESGMELPMPTQILITISNVLRGYWYLVLIGIGALALLGRSYLSTEAGLRKWHSLELQLPVIKGTVMKISAVRFTRTLSTLLSSGMSLLQALEIVIKVVGNRVVMDGLNITKEDIRRGMSLSQSLRKVSALPPMVYSMIGIGEEAGTIENMLEKCAEYYDDEVENAIQKLVSMMEPLLIVFMGVVVGFIIISMILPIFDIYGTI
jgi:type IV pilus assembly protein PilC